MPLIVRVYGAAYIILWIASQIESWYLLDMFLTDSAQPPLTPLQRFGYGVPLLVYGVMFLLPMRAFRVPKFRGIAIVLGALAIFWSAYLSSRAAFGTVTNIEPTERLLGISKVAQITYLALLAVALAIFVAPCGIVVFRLLSKSRALSNCSVQPTAKGGG